MFELQPPTNLLGRCIGGGEVAIGLAAVGRPVLPGRCYRLGMFVKYLPPALCRSPAQRREVSIINMLHVRRHRQPMLPKHIAVQMLLESHHDHSRLNLLDPESFAGRYRSGLHERVHDELLLGLAVSVPKPVKALVGHADKLGMLFLLLLVVSQILIGLSVVGRLIRSRQGSGLIGRPLGLGRCGYLKDFGGA